MSILRISSMAVFFLFLTVSIGSISIHANELSVSDSTAVTSEQCSNPHVKLKDGTIRPATEIDLASDILSVLCCCSKSDGNMCCAETSFCGGYVPGCYCNRVEMPKEGDRT
jgi:hypothetical protein